MLAALTIEKMADQIKHAKGRPKTGLILLAALLVLSLFPTVKNYQTLIYISPYDAMVDRQPRIIQDRLRERILPNIPSGSILIHTLTARVLMSGRTAVYLGSFLYNKEITDYVFQQVVSGTPAYMQETGTCPTFPDKCEYVLKKFKFIPVDTKESSESGVILVKLEPLPAQ